MKLIIDIPEVDYECAKQRWMSGNDAIKTDYYISKGIPLDDVKAEFINLYPKNYMDEPTMGGMVCHFSLNKVLKILDNIGKENELNFLT